MFHDTFAIVPERVDLPSCCFKNWSKLVACVDSPSLVGAGALVLKLMLKSDELKSPVGPFTVCGGTIKIYSVSNCNGGTVITSSPFNAGCSLETCCPLSVICREVPRVMLISNHRIISVIPCATSVCPFAGSLEISCGGFPSVVLLPSSEHEPADSKLINIRHRITCKMIFCITFNNCVP